MRSSAALPRVVVLALILSAAPTATPTTDIVMVFGDSIAFQLAQANPSVINAGVPNERLAAALIDHTVPGMTSGELRIGAALREHRPSTVIILQGANDVFEGMYRGGDEWLIQAADAMASIVAQCQAANVSRIIVATVPPQRIGGRRKRDLYAAHIPRLNERLRAIAVGAGVELLDVHALVSSDLRLLLSDDDVHLTAAANQMIWFWKGLRDVQPSETAVVLAGS